jgi:threonine dehydrogenase-like Zn-dependent dehydrogenase
VSASDACLVEPLAVAAHGIRMLDLKPDSRVAIVGAGAVGLAATAVLTPHVATVDIAARHNAQKEAAERLGAGLDPRGEYDAVVECAGNSAALMQAARLCKPGATILLLATYWDEVIMPAFEISMKGLKIYASFMYDRQGLVRDVDIAAQLMAQRPELPGILITHRLPLDAAADAFALAADRKAGAIKVVLEP